MTDKTMFGIVGFIIGMIFISTPFFIPLSVQTGLIFASGLIIIPLSALYLTIIKKQEIGSSITPILILEIGVLLMVFPLFMSIINNSVFYIIRWVIDYSISFVIPFSLLYLIVHEKRKLYSFITIPVSVIGFLATDSFVLSPYFGCYMTPVVRSSPCPALPYWMLGGWITLLMCSIILLFYMIYQDRKNSEAGYNAA